MHALSACREKEMYYLCQLGLNQRLFAQLLYSVCPEVVKGNAFFMQKHNSCPLCREKYTKILYRRQEIEVQDHTRERRPPRVLPPNPVSQRRIVFLPFTPFVNYQQPPLVPFHSASQAMLMFGPVMHTSLPLCPPPQIFSGLAYSS